MVVCCGGCLVRCDSLLILTYLEHQFVCLDVLYPISGFAWSRGTCLTGPVGSEDAVLTDQEYAVIWKTSAVLHLVVYIHDTSGVVW